MGIRAQASTELGLTLVLFEGIVSTGDFERGLVPLMESPEHNTMRLTLVDASSVTRGDAPTSLVRSAARTVSEQVDGEIAFGDGARIAFASPGDEFFGLGRMYQALREGSPVEVGVFRSVAEAEAWLGLPPDYRERLTEVPLPALD